MEAIIVDDESYCADYLEKLCWDIRGLSIAGKFGNIEDAKVFLLHHTVELVFLDIEMPGSDGISAMKELRRINPALGVIFVTGYEQYAMEAFRADAVSYLLKPCDARELAHAVEKAVKLLPPAESRLEVRTFGHFAVFIDGKPFRFSNTKAQELLAYLVDQRGRVVTMEQAVNLLWEDRPYDTMVKQLYRKAVINLNQISSQNHLDFFVSNRGSCNIIPTAMTCDYFDLLAGEAGAVNKFNGEYMLDYTWGEMTLCNLERQFMK